MAKPSSYTDELGDLICERIAEGRTVSSVCDDDDMPWQGTFYRWLDAHPSLREKVTRAKENRTEAFARKAMDLGERVMTENIHPDRVRVAIYALEKAVQMMSPKTQKIELTGANGKPVEHDHKMKIAADAESFTSAIVGIASKLKESEGD